MITSSLIIPCYNEAENLPTLLERCKELLEKNVEIVLVNNGSTDDTDKMLEDLIRSYNGVKVYRISINQGYGHGIVQGLKYASGDILGWTHADNQADPNDFLKAVEFFKESDNSEKLFVKGLRYGRPLIDRFFTFGMSLFEILLLGYFMRDINAQPTAFHRRFFENFENFPTDFSLDLFFYYKAKRANMIIRRIPVHFGERLFGISHWNTGFISKIKFIVRTVNYSISLKRQLDK